MLHEIIESARSRLGERLLILGHHYQREDVIVHADLVGDSFQLSSIAAEQSAPNRHTTSKSNFAHNQIDNSNFADKNFAKKNCETIIFCGVHFMAETADILANSSENLERRGGERVNVILPDLGAGCSMADMASRESVSKCWDELATIIDIDEVLPITYVNSTAELKAFCGERGGVACTSSNARAVIEWALSKKRRILFFPDQHLGRNTALKMGIPISEMTTWKDGKPEFGGNDIDVIRRSRVLLWDGFCCVHQKFLPGHIDEIRSILPNVKVIVHPECNQEVVAKADEAGSTAYILKRITESPDESVWAVGTESRFVERIAKQNPSKKIVHLAFQPSYCSTMGLITLENLAAMFDPIEKNKPINIIKVEESVAKNALIALQRMLQIT
ncbi:MAG: quinolinate synthase NadA [Planctomycetaceae bacterium]|jgi:quinolinate synthase|nr:quinolinate synthase NadA [Planctomycetaceae bacterium]